MENQNTVNPNVPPIQIPPVSGSKNKFLIILIVVVVALVLIAVSYFLAQKKIVKQVITGKMEKEDIEKLDKEFPGQENISDAVQLKE